MLGLWLPAVACHWCRWSELLPDALPSWRVPCLFPAFLLCLWRVACKYTSIWRFKGVFSGFWGFRVGLYCYGALRGLWGFCAREQLGGYMTCGVFCLSFSSLVLLSSCPAFACSSAWLPALPAFLLFVLPSWLCGLAFGVGWVVGFLSLSDGFRHKKKGRNSLRPLLSRCGLLYMFRVAFIASSFDFEKIHPAPQVR